MWWYLLDYQLFFKKLSLRLKKEKHLQGRMNFLTVKVDKDVAYWRRLQSDHYFMPALVHIMCKRLGALLRGDEGEMGCFVMRDINIQKGDYADEESSK